jgi:DNA-binding HxlR family transcriptional regulator
VFKALYFFPGIIPHDLEIIAILRDWRDSEGSLLQLHREIRYRNDKSRITKKLLQNRLDILVKNKIIYKREYRFAEPHYLLAEFF